MNAPRRKSETLTFRVEAEIKARLENAVNRTPYKITATSIVERGIALALQELERAFPSEAQP